MAGPKVRKKLKKKPVKKDPSFGKVKPPISSVGENMGFISGMSDLTKFANLIKKGHSPREAANLLRNKGRD